MKYQPYIIALLLAVIIAMSIALMSPAPVERMSLPTAPIGGDVPPPATAIPVNMISSFTYEVADISVMTKKAMPVYELCSVESFQIGDLPAGYSWTVQVIKSTADGNYWAANGNGWVLLYDAKVSPPETTDWSLEKWISIGNQ